MSDTRTTFVHPVSRSAEASSFAIFERKVAIALAPTSGIVTWLCVSIGEALHLNRHWPPPGPSNRENAPFKTTPSNRPAGAERPSSSLTLLKLDDYQG